MTATAVTKEESIESFYRPILTAVISIAVLNVLDFLTTITAFHYGATEGNPIAKFLLGYGLLWPTKALVTIVMVGAILIQRYHTKTKPFQLNQVCFMWFVTGIYACVILVNTLTLIRYMVT